MDSSFYVAFGKVLYISNSYKKKGSYRLENKFIVRGLISAIITMCIISAIIPITVGNSPRTTERGSMDEGYFFDRSVAYPQSILFFSKIQPCKTNSNDDLSPEEKKKEEPPLITNDGLMNSPWPMYCHDVRHTGRSPYSTANSSGIEKWRFKLNGWGSGSPVIDDNGIIYIGSSEFYAVYPNGTLKWKYDIPYKIQSAPAIDENGIIYVGIKWAMPCYLYAFYPNGTLKWKYRTGDDIFSSPAIGDDGTIYFGDGNKYINALWPNGTLRWRYKTGHVVYSSPAIGEDGIVYCGSHDSKLYALYPNNGTVKWTFDTGGWIRTSPCIADDDTIYVVSLDDFLYAVYPNGTMKWKTNVGAGTSPTIAQDGTVYAGYSQLYAIHPADGSVRWTFDPGSYRRIRGGTPCTSKDGTIYFGTNIGESSGGEIIAVNPDGTEKWRKMIANAWVDSAPAIGSDGTIYIGSTNFIDDPYTHEGYLHAFGPGDLKRIEIEFPERGKLYLFGEEIISTPRGNTFIIGDIDIFIKGYSEDEIDGGVKFYIHNELRYTDYELPFEWKLDRKFRFLPWDLIRLVVVAKYKGGCEWVDEILFWYFHL